MIIVQENRSFDNLFHAYPGADTADWGSAHDGTRVPLRPVSLKVGYDISNGFADYMRSYNNGRMNGWDMRPVLPITGVPFSVADYPQYGYVPHRESAAYFDLAHQYVLADRMFQSNVDLSFAAHLYLIAGQAARSVNTPQGRPWGCDASYGTTVRTLLDNRKFGPSVFPCFDLRTIGDELTDAGLDWRYYAPRVDSAAYWKRFSKSSEDDFSSRYPDIGQLWSSYDAIAHDRYGIPWRLNVVSPQTQVLRDVQKGELASVTWVIPSWRDSDHSDSKSSSGPRWVTSIVNTIGRSRFWSDTVILITWDDSGGWYDHVSPPQLDYDGLGIRVPLLVVSPYAKRGYVAHTQYEFGSVLKLAEETFGLAPLAASDTRANNLSDCFDFDQQPRPFKAFTHSSTKEFFAEKPSGPPPDMN